MNENRYIKFRVWDNKKMVILDKSYFIDCQTLAFTTKENVDIYTHGEMLYFSEYTGLKDKKGKEIYEGDILKAFNKYIGRVIFEKGAWVFSDSERSLLCLAIESQDLKIIGNIYENPELMPNNGGF